MKGKSVPLSESMAKVGRGMAKAKNQASSPKVPSSFKSGGGVTRGAGAAVKGKNFSGAC